MVKKFKGENSKVTAAKEKKAASEAVKQSAKASQQEKKESEEWSKGAKKGGKKESEESKKAERLAKKAELEALKASEERELAKIKTVRSAGTSAKQAKKKEGEVERRAEELAPRETFSASNIEDAIDAMTLAAGQGEVRGTALDKHPERRHKAAWNGYYEREFPRVQEEYKGLRLSQYRELLWKQWQKSPDNPFNQQSLAYNATSVEAQEARAQIQREMEERLRG